MKMGIGLLLSTLIFGGAAIDAAIDNHNMMKEPVRYLEDGTPVYIDRKCKQHINGEKVVTTWTHDSKGHVKLIEVGERSGRVYNDPEENKRKRMDAMSEQYKREAIERGHLAYKKYDHRVERFITCEISTGRYIAALRGNKYGMGYRKFYLPNNYESYNLYKKADGDEGIEITRDEFNKLNIVGGSHSTYSHY